MPARARSKGSIAEIFALMHHSPSDHLVGWVAHEGRSEGRLARSIAAHDGVHLTGADREVDALEDRCALHLNMQILDLQQRGVAHG